MRIDVPRTALWLTLPILLVACGLALLRACDLGPLPLFGLRYCVAAEPDSAFAAERARAQELQARIREAELRIAEKPICGPPLGPKNERETQLNPPIIPHTGPNPEEPTIDPLTIPKKISELKGCWESVRGDLPIVTDDEEERLVGHVRKCYCFGANGRGQLKMSYTEGAKCRAPIYADLSGETLRIHQPKFSCIRRGQNKGLVPAEITCRGAESEAAACDEQIFARKRTSRTGDQYRRVGKDHCG